MSTSVLISSPTPSNAAGAGQISALPAVAVEAPARLAARFPLSRGAVRGVERYRAEVIELVQGAGDRLLCVVGPCSIHDPRSALEYADRLAELAARHSNELLIAMRVYLEKPRSSVGWKGLISDPHLDGSCDIVRGLELGREIMVGVAERGLPVTTELLDINLAGYFSDVLSWAAVGARTTESQPHRELASSLPFAVGFKNGTDGRVDGALGGIVGAAQPHRRLAPGADGRLMLLQSSGNPHCHLTLRGGTNGPNYDAASVAAASDAARRAGRSASVLVDASHGNSGKDHLNQPLVTADVAARVAAGARDVLGVMIESHLVAGRQALVLGCAGLRYGQSITDACVDVAMTETMLNELGRAVQQRRAAASMK
ncbi:MAG TPA: 3-deoxy-7-phosphoheptulonate synthase [Polyangiaceae bacterium]|nr:3-deoxy-7-phosphoheptulonate synthase [Polyangiaceae bacterium]